VLHERVLKEDFLAATDVRSREQRVARRADDAAGISAAFVVRTGPTTFDRRRS
jgi:hypothetical protein